MFKLFKNKTVYEDEKVLSQENNEELVSIIAAAIAASIGAGIPEINIKSIRRAPQYDSQWNRMAKIEGLFGKF